MIASPIRRAVQTAVAMGYPRPRLDPRWAGFADDVRLRHAWPVSFTTARDILVTDAGTRRAASDLLQWVGEAAGEVSEGERVLIVTHGGFPELLAVAELPAVDPGGWGGVLRCMEGVRLRLDGTVPRSLEVLRVPDALTRV